MFRCLCGWLFVCFVCVCLVVCSFVGSFGCVFVCPCVYGRVLCVRLRVSVCVFDVFARVFVCDCLFVCVRLFLSFFAWLFVVLVIGLFGRLCVCVCLFVRLFVFV